MPVGAMFHLAFGANTGAPVAVAAGADGLQAQFHRPEDVHRAGWIGDRRKIGVGRRRHPALDLHDPTSEISAASTA